MTIKIVSNQELLMTALNISYKNIPKGSIVYKEVTENVETLLLQNEEGHTVAHWLANFKTYEEATTTFPPEVLVAYSTLWKQTVEDVLVEEGKI